MKKAALVRSSCVSSLSAAIVTMRPRGLSTFQERCKVVPPTPSKTTSISRTCSSKRTLSISYGSDCGQLLTFIQFSGSTDLPQPALRCRAELETGRVSEAETTINYDGLTINHRGSYTQKDNYVGYILRRADSLQEGAFDSALFRLFRPCPRPWCIHDTWGDGVDAYLRRKRSGEILS